MHIIDFFKHFTVENGSSLPDFSLNVDAPTLNDVPITCEIVFTKLNPNQAAVPDNWPPKVLKLSCAFLLPFYLQSH